MLCKRSVLISLCLAVGSSLVQGQDQNKKGSSQFPVDSGSAPQRFTQEGVSVEFSANSVSTGSGKSAELLAGAQAVVRFRIADANGGKALTNLRPAVWIDVHELGQASDSRRCREKIQSFLQPSFDRRPTIDLNAYFILALNDEPNISVIDPYGGFGGSKLYTLIPLRSPGADWLMSRDRRKLFVSMPSARQVAVIDTVNWKVITNIDTGKNPSRLALQHDDRYLWIADDDASSAATGVSVVDTITLKVAAQIVTGEGPHEIAFDEEDNWAFVTNKRAGTVSVIDVRKLAQVSSSKVGSLPSAIAFSGLSKAFYVANEGDGIIVELDGSGRESRRMKAQPGLGMLKFTSDGRFGFVVNGSTNNVSIFDVASGKIIRIVPVGPAPDQITFTRDFAYVRSSGNEFVTMIKIADIGKEAALSRFPAGQKAPRESRSRSMAAAVVPSREDGAVLVANPADKMIYFYAEGMAAPMGSFQNYRREPRALLIVDQSLREATPGEYTTTVKLSAAGQYDVAFLLDSPRLVNCFQLQIAENPSLAKPAGVAMRVDPVAKDEIAKVGETHNLRFRVTDSRSNKPITNLNDVGVLVFLAPGIWQQRAWAKNLGEGLYETSFVPPQAGVYYVFFQCPSLEIQFNQISPLTLQAVRK